MVFTSTQVTLRRVSTDMFQRDPFQTKAGSMSKTFSQDKIRWFTNSYNQAERRCSPSIGPRRKLTTEAKP